jgi:hypothetical protein
VHVKHVAGPAAQNGAHETAAGARAREGVGG